LLDAEEGPEAHRPCYTSAMSTWLPQRRADAGAVLLRDFPAPIVAVGCEACARAGRYRLPTLLERFEPAAGLPDVLAALAADCPRQGAGRFSDTCGARFTDLGRQREQVSFVRVNTGRVARHRGDPNRLPAARHLPELPGAQPSRTAAATTAEGAAAIRATGRGCRASLSPWCCLLNSPTPPLSG